jgi:hypothetical protein
VGLLLKLNDSDDRAPELDDRKKEKPRDKCKEKVTQNTGNKMQKLQASRFAYLQARPSVCHAINIYEGHYIFEERHVNNCRSVGTRHSRGVTSSRRFARVKRVKIIPQGVKRKEKPSNVTNQDHISG